MRCQRACGSHVDLVCSTALRSVQDPHLARDIVQKVFILLARKPGSIRNAHMLAGWLYRTTRFTAASTLRTERRQREHERAAMELNTLQPDSCGMCLPGTGPVATDWGKSAQA
jgi:DNA-directed RNA polymerase specialized sigma24 family protein